MKVGQHEDAAEQCRNTDPRGLLRPAAVTTMTLEELMKEFPEEGSQPGNESAISLHDLLARGTAVDWDEAVAIVEEMCEVAIATSGEEAPVPSLADVLLDANGRLTLSRQGHGETSPTAAGRALHALLANANVPMPLRLFVTQSTAPETYGSLRAFAAGLAYFDRPNRTALIQDVYKRAADLVRAGVEAAQAPPPVPVQEKKPKKESSKSKRVKPQTCAAMGCRGHVGRRRGRCGMGLAERRFTRHDNNGRQRSLVAGVGRVDRSCESGARPLESTGLDECRTSGRSACNRLTSETDAPCRASERRRRGAAGQPTTVAREAERLATSACRPDRGGSGAGCPRRRTRAA